MGRESRGTTHRTMCSSLSSLSRLISRIAVLGTPSSSASSRIFFRATIEPVETSRALYTTPYVPGAALFQLWTHRPRCGSHTFACGAVSGGSKEQEERRTNFLDLCVTAPQRHSAGIQRFGDELTGPFSVDSCLGESTGSDEGTGRGAMRVEAVVMYSAVIDYLIIDAFSCQRTWMRTRSQTARGSPVNICVSTGTGVYAVGPSAGQLLFANLCTATAARDPTSASGLSSNAGRSIAACSMSYCDLFL